MRCREKYFLACLFVAKPCGAVGQLLVEASGSDLKKGGKDWLERCLFRKDDAARFVGILAKNLLQCFVAWCEPACKRQCTAVLRLHSP